MAQKEVGVAYKNNFGSFAYSGYLPEDGLTWVKNDYPVVDEVTDVDGDTVSKLYQNPRDTLSVTLFITDAGGSITPPNKGDALTLTDPGGASIAYGVESASTSFSRGRTKLTLSLIKEVGMTY